MSFERQTLQVLVHVEQPAAYVKILKHLRFIVWEDIVCLTVEYFKQIGLTFSYHEVVGGMIACCANLEL